MNSQKKFALHRVKNVILGRKKRLITGIAGTRTCNLCIAGIATLTKELPDCCRPIQLDVSPINHIRIVEITELSQVPDTVHTVVSVVVEL